MTDKEKFEKLEELADAMYYAAQYLTTDASRLHKAMDKYHQFIINEYHKEEPVSKDLEEAAKHYLYSNILYDDVYVGNPTEKDCIEMFKAGAKWQKEQMMAKAVDSELYSGGMFIPLIGLKDKEKVSDIKFGDKIKAIILKDK